MQEKQKGDSLNIGLVFPHQLFEESPIITHCSIIYLVEETLFFNQYPFHKQKIAFHRASMKFYEQYLLSQGKKVVYIEAGLPYADIRKLIVHLKEAGVQIIEIIDPTDNWLEKRIKKACKTNGLQILEHENPMFLNTRAELKTYFSGKKKMFQTDFYKNQRYKRNILMESDQKPKGGQWTFDSENRLKYPKGKRPPKIKMPASSSLFQEAMAYTQRHFSTHYGALNPDFQYPVTFEETRQWLDDFLENRLLEFGPFEDAMVDTELVLHHSLLTPMLNVGLITPDEILTKTLDFATTNPVPINSLEGFVRQILGWREFIRAVYEIKGTEERTRNFWGFTRKIPPTFWEGTTGIEPVDATIKKVLKTGYCHHIERLMVLGNFMLLCEFDPDEVYHWFMEMFIDSYDWVMVPNVYGMSQFADGGLMSTKPYISGSNYLLKMSNYKKGPWQEIWDGLFWRFLHVHRGFFSSNPRLGMLISSFEKMPPEKRERHLNNANDFLKTL